MMFFSCNALKCVSVNNQECKVRLAVININSNEPSFYPYNTLPNKCSGSCNDINDSNAKLCVPDVAKNMNIKVFNLISRINEAMHVSWHETCTCKCRLDASICNNKKHWNNDKCRCECKKLIDKGRCDNGFIWNRSVCECKCDKSCGIGQYLDYKNYKCRKELIDKLVEECSQNINRNEIIFNVTLNDYGKVCKSCKIYIVPLIITFIIIIGFSSAFFYFYWLKKKKYISGIY